MLVFEENEKIVGKTHFPFYDFGQVRGKFTKMGIVSHFVRNALLWSSDKRLVRLDCDNFMIKLGNKHTEDTRLLLPCNGSPLWDFSSPEHVEIGFDFQSFKEYQEQTNALGWNEYARPK